MVLLALVSSSEPLKSLSNEGAKEGSQDSAAGTALGDFEGGRSHGLSGTWLSGGSHQPSVLPPRAAGSC